MAELFRYAAFISYSSKDAVFAQRLHRALESYDIPSSLGKFDLIGGGKPNRIYPVFRDREELSAGQLGEQIEANLKASAALIVVCSPDGAASPWVQKEIEFFASLGRHEKIFAIIPDTAPLADAQGRDCTQDCFPPAFRGDALAGDTLEPLAADARKGKDGFRNAWLKIVAGMIGVTPGQIIDRDRARMRRDKLIARTSVAFAFTAVAFVAGMVDGFAWRSIAVAQARAVIEDGRYLDSLPLLIASDTVPGDVLPLPVARPQLQRRSDAGIVADLGSGFVQVDTTGKFASIASAGGSASVLDLATGLLVKQMEDVLTLSPFAGSHLAWAKSDGDVELFDASTGTTQVVRLSLAPIDAIYRIRVSSDGRHFAVNFGGDASIYSREGALIATLPNADYEVGDFSPSGEYFAMQEASDPSLSELEQTTYGRRTWIVDLHNGLTRALPLARYGPAYRFSPDGGSLALFDARSTASVLFPREGRVIELGAAEGTPEFLDGDNVLLFSGAHAFRYSISRRELSSLIDLSGELLDADVSDDGERVLILSRSPSGVRAAVVGWRTDSIVWIAPLGADSRPRLGGGRHVLDWDSASNLARVWSDENGELIFERASNGGIAVHAEGVTYENLDGDLAFTSLYTGRDWIIGHGERLWGGARVLSAGHRLFVIGPTGGSYLLDPRIAETEPRRSGAAICATRGDDIRPFAQELRGASIATDEHLRKVYALLRGRPWNPCDWRGLLAILPDATRGDGWFEGARQWLRLMQVRYFGGRDYACEETTSAASDETRASRRDMCERFDGEGRELAATPN